MKALFLSEVDGTSGETLLSQLPPELRVSSGARSGAPDSSRPLRTCGGTAATSRLDPSSALVTPARPSTSPAGHQPTDRGHRCLPAPTPGASWALDRRSGAPRLPPIEAAGLVKSSDRVCWTLSGDAAGAQSRALRPGRVARGPPGTARLCPRPSLPRVPPCLPGARLFLEFPQHVPGPVLAASLPGTPALTEASPPREAALSPPRGAALPRLATRCVRPRSPRRPERPQSLPAPAAGTGPRQRQGLRGHLLRERMNEVAIGTKRKERGFLQSLSRIRLASMQR